MGWPISLLIYKPLQIRSWLYYVCHHRVDFYSAHQRPQKKKKKKKTAVDGQPNSHVISEEGCSRDSKQSWLLNGLSQANPLRVLLWSRIHSFHIIHPSIVKKDFKTDFIDCQHLLDLLYVSCPETSKESNSQVSLNVSRTETVPESNSEVSFNVFTPWNSPRIWFWNIPQCFQHWNSPRI